MDEIEQIPAESLINQQIRSSLKPIENLLADPEVTDIFIYGPNNISFTRRGQQRQQSDARWTSEKDLKIAISQMGRYLKRKIDDKNPILDTRLPDGSRVNVIVHPCYPQGACITIRRFPKIQINHEDLVKFGSIDEAGIEILKGAIKKGKNILISGGTGTGKTTLLNIMASFIPENDSVVTIEDAQEIQLKNKYWAALERKEKINQEDNEVTIRDLLKNALRMNPRWVIVGEVRGDEVIDLLRAFNTGHSGISTIHSNSCQDAILAIETLMMNFTNQRIEAIRMMISRVINVVVQINHYQDLRRRVAEIVEIGPVKYQAGNSEISMETIYSYQDIDGMGKFTIHGGTIK